MCREVDVGPATLSAIGRALEKLQAWRSTQLDSEFLENEVFASLLSCQPLTLIFKYTPLQHSFISGTRRGELLELALKGILQSILLVRSNATLGQGLLGICYAKSSKIQRASFLFIRFLLPLVLKKTDRTGNFDYWKTLGVALK